MRDCPSLNVLLAFRHASPAHDISTGYRTCCTPGSVQSALEKKVLAKASSIDLRVLERRYNL